MYVWGPHKPFESASGPYGYGVPRGKRTHFLKWLRKNVASVKNATGVNVAMGTGASVEDATGVKDATGDWRTGKTRRA